MQEKRNRVLFVDRDGTICQGIGPISRWRDLIWIPGAIEALRAINEFGFPIVVISNQAAIAKGLVTLAEVTDLNRSLIRYLREREVNILASLFCPHHPEAVVDRYRVDCSCRKPKTGLIDESRKRFGIDVSGSWLVGDNSTDIACGQAASCARNILVRSGHGWRYQHDAQEVVDSIQDIPELIRRDVL